MENIVINRQIVVLNILTEEYKAKALAETGKALEKLEADFGVFEKEAKKKITELTLTGSGAVGQYQAQLQAEQEKKQTVEGQLRERLAAIGKMEIGGEVLEGTIQGPVELKVGDNFNKINKAEVVLRDGIVVEIR